MPTPSNLVTTSRRRFSTFMGLFFLLGKCIYQRGRDIPWSECDQSQQTVEKRLDLAKVRGKLKDCPKIKVMSKTCHFRDKKKARKARKDKKKEGKRSGKRKSKKGETFYRNFSCSNHATSHNLQTLTCQNPRNPSVIWN